MGSKLILLIKRKVVEAIIAVYDDNYLLLIYNTSYIYINHTCELLL